MTVDDLRAALVDLPGALTVVYADTGCGHLVVHSVKVVGLDVKHDIPVALLSEEEP